ncbi:hypothetical protein AGOR_G00229070 [Albula goreensis]|uniref:Cyclin C-terminal domain-containing protein n=1 Tax=Albula goreensis TaxID=1534307 RepID=A0A8T3CPP0_9TELE|nr:hypothetical protein AGOR_G00229070 [Albula goreensis]
MSSPLRFEEEGRSQGQLRALWDPNASGQRVIHRLLRSEERYLPSLLYISLIQRDPRRREKLAKRTLEEMERVVLATLRWDVASVTPQDFIPHFLSALGGIQDGKTEQGVSLLTLRRHSDTLVAMCVCDSSFLGTPPSLLSAAAVNSAVRGLGNWGPQLGHVTTMLTTLCQADMAVLQYYTDMIEGALRKHLRNGQRRMEKEGRRQGWGNRGQKRQHTNQPERHQFLSRS